jgi:hypothetical protein
MSVGNFLFGYFMIVYQIHRSNEKWKDEYEFGRLYEEMVTAYFKAFLLRTNSNYKNSFRIAISWPEFEPKN